MNPITKAMDEIRFSIPAEILNEVFISSEFRGLGQAVSLETRIREQVLDQRVLVDIDLQGGTEALIPMDAPVKVNQPDRYTVIYQIPDEVLDGRPIVQVYSIHFAILGYHNAGMALQFNESAMSAATRQVFDSAMKTPPAATSYLNMIAPNTVMAKFVYLPYPNAFMRVRLGSDHALSHIRPQAFHAFSELSVLAVKAYIYNYMVVKMDQGQLSGGQMLGAFREIISNYAEADERYREKLSSWRRISVFNDPEANRRHIRLAVGIPS